jgi:hypothetical protein
MPRRLRSQSAGDVQKSCRAALRPPITGPIMPLPSHARLLPNASGEMMALSVIGLSDDAEGPFGRAAQQRLARHPGLTAARATPAPCTLKTGADKAPRLAELDAIKISPRGAAPNIALMERLTHLRHAAGRGWPSGDGADVRWARAMIGWFGNRVCGAPRWQGALPGRLADGATHRSGAARGRRFCARFRRWSLARPA